MDYLIILKGALEILGLISTFFFGLTLGWAMDNRENWFYPVIFFSGSTLWLHPPWEYVL